MKHLKHFDINESFDDDKLTKITNSEVFFEKYGYSKLTGEEISEIVSLFKNKCLIEEEFNPTIYDIVFKNESSAPSEQRSLTWAKIGDKSGKELADLVKELGLDKFDTIIIENDRSEGYSITKGNDDYYLAIWYCPYEQDTYICDEMDGVRMFFS